MLLKVSLAIVGILVFGSNANAAESKLSRIFQPEALRAQIPYLEKIVGPAMHVESEGQVDARDYRVDGCKVTVYANNVEALGYSLDLTPKCNIDLGRYLGNGYSTTKGLTVGKFARGPFGSDLRAQSECIDGCGNAADPTIDFTWEGPRAVQNITIVLTVMIASDQSIAAADRWQKVMQSKEGTDYVTETKFNCEVKYDRTAVQAFSDVPVTHLTIGYAPHEDEFKRTCK